MSIKLWRCQLFLLLFCSTFHSFANPADSASNEYHINSIKAETSEKVFDYLESISTVNTGTPFKTLDFQSENIKTILSTGWHIENSEITRSNSIWAGPQQSVIEIQRIYPTEIEIALTVDSFPNAWDLPSQTIDILWNNTQIKSVSFDQKTTIKITIPKELQNYGLNRLRFLPHYWIRPISTGNNKDTRALSFRLFSLQIHEKNDAFSHGLLPEIADESLYQYPNSIITNSFFVPPNAQLRARYQFAELEKGLDSTVHSKLIISVLDESGKEYLLSEQDIKNSDINELRELDINLGIFKDSYISLSISLVKQVPTINTLPASKKIRIEWEELYVSGENLFEELLISEELPQQKSRPNVLIILLDQLRSDFMTAYQDSGAETPYINSIAREGIRFENAISATTWTRPSVTSLLTSNYPSVHKTLTMQDSLSPDIPYLPEIFSQAGYNTIGVINNGQIASAWGYNRGYSSFIEIYKDQDFLKLGGRKYNPIKHADLVWNKYLSSDFVNSTDTPIFAYIHEIDPHYPYDATEKFRGMYPTPFERRIRLSTRTIGILREDPSLLKPSDIISLKNEYKAEITMIDTFVGRLLDNMRKVNALDSTIVVLISDHGEAFLEHRNIGHGRTLHAEELRVPLLMRYPTIIPQGVVSEPHVQLMDIAPTLMELTGIPQPDTIQGESLRPYWEKEIEQLPIVPKFAELAYGNWKSVNHGQWKLIYKDLNEEEGYSLFNLKSDPNEYSDLWAEELVVGKALQQLLKQKEYTSQKIKFTPAENIKELDAELEENLRALGYLE